MLQLNDRTGSSSRAVGRTARVRRARAMTAALLDLDGRMVDREDEQNELRDAVDAAGRVGGGCVLLSGALQVSASRR